MWKSPMFNSVLVRYGEIGLKKGSTRIKFEKRLIQNMRYALKEAGISGTFAKEWGGSSLILTRLMMRAR